MSSALILLLFFVVALAGCGSYALAGSPGETLPVDSAECKELSARLLKATGAGFIGTSPMGNDVILRHETYGEIRLSCTTHRLTGVKIGSATAHPSSEWFSFVALAGASITGGNSKAIETGVRKCLRSALKKPGFEADAELPLAKIECIKPSAGDESIFADVWLNDHEARRGVEEPE